MTSVKNGNMVITAGSSSEEYVTVINRAGTIQRQDKIKHTTYPNPSRCCSRLSEFKVATVSKSYEVGIYDIRDGSYKSTNIKEIIKNCETVKCITTDLVKIHIIIGTIGREVHMFDDQLHYIKTVQLPDVASNQIDISVHEGNLLVCSNTKSAYAVTMGKSRCDLLCEFIKPDVSGGHWKPFSVCANQNGRIFILWQAFISGDHRRILVQYSQDGRQVLTQMPVDKNSVSMTTVKQDDAELLIVATRDTGELFTYRH